MITTISYKTKFNQVGTLYKINGNKDMSISYLGAAIVHFGRGLGIG